MGCVYLWQGILDTFGMQHGRYLIVAVELYLLQCFITIDKK